MNNIYWRGVGKGVLGDKYTSDTVATWFDGDADFLKNKIGISERWFLSHDQTAVDLAGIACQNLLAQEPSLDLAAIDLLIFVTQNPDYQLPHSAAVLQHRLGLPTSVMSFDIGLGCSGYVYALSVCKALMQSLQFDNALIVTSDPYSKIMSKSDRDTVSVFGDAATATWISSESGALIGEFDFGTDGSGSHELIHDVATTSGLFQHAIAPPTHTSLKMNGRAIFNFMLRQVPKSVQKCLDNNDTTLDEIELFAFHQASQFMLQTLTRKLNLPPAKVPINIEKIGNTVSSSIPYLLAEQIETDALHTPSGKVLLCGFGVGLSWASAVLDFSTWPTT